jgi:inositol phosphorylceramide mannosyltransferase catalytic subunit
MLTPTIRFMSVLLCTLVVCGSTLKTNSTGPAGRPCSSIARDHKSELLEDGLRMLQQSLKSNMIKLERLQLHVQATHRYVERVLGASAAGNASAGHLHIPRIIHQSWKTKDLPPKFQRWHSSWRRVNPDWTMRLWTDDHNLELVTTHFPWFKDTYVALPANIMRADSARYMYMYTFGGVYADLDMECLKPMDDLLMGHRCVLARMGNDPDFSHSIPNAFMASEPGHAFWLLCLFHITEIHRKDPNSTAEALTGPVMLKQVMDDYWYKFAWHNNSLTVLAPGLIYPFDWNGGSDHVRATCHSMGKDGFNETSCKNMFPDAYAITYWEHSWRR